MQLNNQTIQFSISTQFKCQTALFDPGATTSGQSELGSDGNEGVLRISQSSSVSGALPSDCLVLCPGYSLGEYYPSAEMQLVYSAAPADRAKGGSTYI